MIELRTTIPAQAIKPIIEVAPAQISAALRGLPVTGWQLTIDGATWTLGCVIATADFPCDEIRVRLVALLEHDLARPRIDVVRIAQLERGPSGKSTVVKTIAR